MKRALIIRTGAVGDVVLTLPVLAALKHHYPEIKIDVLGNKTNLSLLIEGGYAETALSIDRREMTSLFVKDGLPSAAIRRIMQTYDLVVSYLPDPDGVFTSNIRQTSNGQVLTGSARPIPHLRTHMTQVLMAVLRPLNIHSMDLPPTLRVPPSSVPDCYSTRERVIAIHPGSGGKYKCWPPDRYAALIKRIDALGFRPLITVGPADDDTLSELLSLVDKDSHFLFENRSLTEIAGMLSQCRAMIGNDTGITHLAAAVGTPVIALFGPTDPAVWGPRGQNVHILWGNENIEEDAGIRSWGEPFAERALTEIEVDHVMEVLVGLEGVGKTSKQIY